MINSECVEQLLDLLSLKDQLINKLQAENQKLKEDNTRPLVQEVIAKREQEIANKNNDINNLEEELKTKNEEIESKSNQLTKIEQELNTRDQIISKLEDELTSKDSDINKLEEEINNKAQQIQTMKEDYNDLKQRYLSEVDTAAHFIDQLGKDLEKKDKLLQEEYVQKIRYDEVVRENQRKREKVNNLENLLVAAQEETEQSRTLLDIKSKEYNTSFTSLKEVTLGQLDSFELACQQAAELQKEVTRLTQLLEQKSKDAHQAQLQAQAIEKNMSQMKVKYEQELYITKQMLKSSTRVKHK